MSEVMPGPTPREYITAVRENSALLASAARLGLDVSVPTCPGWYMATLVAHLGEVQRFWALQVSTRAQEARELPHEAFDSCPGLYEWGEKLETGAVDMQSVPPQLIPWFEASTVELVNAFESVAPEEIIWHWSGDNRGITHLRNQAMEATVHRWDAQNAHGITTRVDPNIALDGIEQHFDVQIAAARKWGEPRAGSGERFHFHRTDGHGEWLVVFDGDEVTVRREHAKGDVAVRGAVEDLFLWLWGRAGSERLDVVGDATLLERYRELVPGV